MAMKYHNLTNEDYITQKYNFIVWVEETGNVKTTLYRDSKGFPTIGAGFKVTSNLEEILKAFGFDWKALPETTEYNYIKRIKAKFYTDTAMTKEKTFSTAEITALQTELNAIMAERAGSRTTFAFTDTNEIKTTFQVIADEREKTLTKWLNAKGISIPDSNERITLLSLVYNNIIGFNDAEQTKPKSTKLLDALASANRAEAWFEMRYNSNGDKLDGIAKRRYFEADYFGLYDAGTKTNEEKTLEFKTIFRMYTIHTDKIISYDNTYGSQVAKANSDYQVSWVKSTTDDLKDAKDYLIANFSNGVSIDGEVIIGKGLSTYEYKDKGSYDDQITGTANGDLIFGEKGNDNITGGKGDDVIYGGAGNDTYFIKTGDGIDRIEDKEGINRVIVNGILIGDFIRQADGSYKTADSLFTAVMQGSDFVVTEVSTGTSVILNENFQDGDFGIHLLDMPVDPVTSTTIVGDLAPMNPSNPDYDALDNLITDPVRPSPNRNDLLYDSSGNDRIEGGGGDDTIFANRGGDDWILGGDGRDAISSYNSTGAPSDNDIIEGGAGGDVILAGPGDDQLFGESYGDRETLIANGEVAQGINEKGDLASGDTGNDLIYGSARNDALFGGEGHDLLVVMKTSIRRAA